MTARIPLVRVSGRLQELPAGDTIKGEIDPVDPYPWVGAIASAQFGLQIQIDAINAAGSGTTLDQAILATQVFS